MRFLADFRLDSDLCLAEGAPPIEVQGPGGGYCLTITNAKPVSESDDGLLAARLEFDAGSLEDARSAADGLLEQCLNALTLTTGRKFIRERLRLVIDWEPGKTMREAHLLGEVPVWDRAEPGLDESFARTAEHLLSSLQDDRIQAASRWYRLAIASNDLNEQYSYFWFALEIVAQIGKDAEKIPSRCPHCRTALYCETCSRHPVHRKYESQVIESVIRRYIKAELADSVFKSLQKIRHGLMHGERLKDIVVSLPMSEEEAMNTLHHVARTAIIDAGEVEWRMDADPVLGFVDDVRRRRLVVTTHVSTGVGGDPMKPNVGNLPTIEISMVRGDGSKAKLKT